MTEQKKIKSIDINGTSKVKRLRCYLRQESTSNVIKVLLALWEYREAPEGIKRNKGKSRDLPMVDLGDCNKICVTAYPYPLMGLMIGSYTELFTVSNSVR